MTKELVSVFRKAHFNAAHRLNVPAWSEAENIRVFDKCNNSNFHGHNYELVVKVTGEVDATTGFVIDLKILNNIIQQEIVARFDHRNLNLDTQEFKELNPTAENIAIIIYRLIRAKIDSNLDLQIRLYETERNFVEYPVSK
ncbi:6-pyruvoyl trahydropterin synthase family protein [Arachidicoccus sp.]|jgi:6-pyruvoyltetrahydropterin/6-carboxytetrahydropterin synthase|uniref:6-pyruvoyl trahydropterin synthase family protein n=1 Tax=Arachidicoccus sp. TaxID=1872624 RepID=UPI003D25E0F3